MLVFGAERDFCRSAAEGIVIGRLSNRRDLRNKQLLPGCSFLFGSVESLLDIGRKPGQRRLEPLSIVGSFYGGYLLPQCPDLSVDRICGCFVLLPFIGGNQRMVVFHKAIEDG